MRIKHQQERGSQMELPPSCSSFQVSEVFFYMPRGLMSNSSIFCRGGYPFSSYFFFFLISVDSVPVPNFLHFVIRQRFHWNVSLPFRHAEFQQPHVQAQIRLDGSPAQDRDRGRRRIHRKLLDGQSRDLQLCGPGGQHQSSHAFKVINSV